MASSTRNSRQQLTAFLAVVMIDIVLAGDNAVVVGTAAAGLPARQQRRVIALGASLALVARIVFALMATQLLAIVGLLLAGGLLLLWVAWKMWRELEADRAAARNEIPSTLPGLESTAADRPEDLSLGGRSRWPSPTSRCRSTTCWRSPARRATTPGSWCSGWCCRSRSMAVAAGFIARLIDRHRWLAYAGLAVILVVALKMIWEGGHEVLLVTARM